jgi:hypothetical protein
MTQKEHSDRCRTWRAAAMVGALAVLAAPLSAAVIPLSTAATVDDLFAGVAAPKGLLKVEAVASATFDVTIYSQAYSDGDEFAYLYQLRNDAGSPDPLEMFTISPFTGADATVDMGYLTDAVPAGFLAAVDQEPEPTGNMNLSGPLLSFYYTSRADFDIDPGQNSNVMYVKSEMPPDLIWGNVIDGSVVSTMVVGPVPEPGTMLLLAAGASAGLLRRRRR